MRLAQIRNLILLSLASSVWAGCSYSVQKAPPAGTVVSAEMLSKVSYQMVKTQVFDRSCVSCHGTSGNLSLETYESALSVLDKIKSSTLDERRMPKAPNPALDSHQLEVLAAWIQVGGRKLPADGSDDAAPPPTLAPTYSSIHKLILEQKCVRCHRADSNSQANQMPFTTYDEIRNNPRPILFPEQPDEGEGLLLEVLRAGARKPMPPLDSGISPVKPEEIQIIEEWIRNGAQNN